MITMMAESNAAIAARRAREIFVSVAVEAEEQAKKSGGLIYVILGDDVVITDDKQTPGEIIYIAGGARE